jgi:hypothetical protein
LQGLVDTLSEYNAHIAAVQEVRWIGKGVIHNRNADFYYSCHPTSHSFGIGFVVSKQLKECVMDFRAINERLGMLRIRGRFFNMSIINCHAPTEEKPEDDKDAFYEDLERLYDSCPRNDIKIVIGDMNAKVGQEDIYKRQIGRHSLHIESNQNGIRLVNFAAAKGMVVGSTMFPRKGIHKETWVSPDGTTRNQIDHVLVDSRHFSNLMSVRTYRGANIDSDHYLVGAVLRARLSITKTGRSSHKERYNTAALKSDEVARLFKERIQENLDLEESSTSSDKWKKFQSVVRTAAESTLGMQDRQRRNFWFDAECQEATSKKNEAYKRIQQRYVIQDAVEHYKELRRTEKRLHKAKKKQWENKALEELESLRSHNETRKFYRMVNSQRKNFMPRTVLCRSKNGELLSEQRKVLCRWAEHFQDLLNNPEEMEDTVEQTGGNHTEQEAPSVEEVQRAVDGLKAGRAPGEDGIPSELFKGGGRHLIEQLHRIILQVWNQESMPEDWSAGLICPIHKKGDPMECKNYRGITLLNIGYKVFSKILFERLKPFVEDTVGQYQAGFRTGRSTVDQVFVLRQILEKTWEYNIDTYHLFVDFKAAYDSVSRTKLYKAMQEFGIPEKLINLTKMTMSAVVCRVRIQDSTSEPFETKCGLRQGDALSCLLFNVALERIVREANVVTTGNIFCKSTQILAYADDVDIIGRSLTALKEAFTNIDQAAKHMGLQVNEEKTKVMGVSTSEARLHNMGQEVNLNGRKIGVVRDFVYLGSLMNSTNDSKGEVKRRILLANKCYYGTSKHLRSRMLSRATKFKIYRTLILPVLTYGNETWTMTKNEENLLNVFERKILRRICGGIKVGEVWRRRSNEEVYSMYEHPDVVTIIKIGRLRWAGHLIRAEEAYPPRKIMLSKPEGKRRPGRPRLRWLDCVDRDASRIGVRRWRVEATNREAWRHKLEEAKTCNGLSCHR